MGRVIATWQARPTHRLRASGGASIVVAVLARPAARRHRPRRQGVVVTPGRSFLHASHNSRADVAVGSCTMVSGSWKMTGTVKNRRTPPPRSNW